ncbi:uncharacterized protein PG998_010316 [Apiospora kogelbergensis]|uniref:uncharacterized protein n=1 Tax=Apiospora kogelbergensis TaxID=1337665 RepID=UPI00312D4728
MSLRISLPRLSSFGFSQITTPGPPVAAVEAQIAQQPPSFPPSPSPRNVHLPRLSPTPFYGSAAPAISHNYCTRVVASESTDPASSSPSAGGSKKRRRRNKYCRSEFDYEGWEKWGTWRRGHALGIESTRAEDADSELRERESKFIRKTQDCSVHCDYPSQCFHTRIRVLEDELRAVEKEGEGEGETLTEEDDEILKAYAASKKILHEEDYEEDCEEEDDDYLELNLARDLPEDDEDARSPTSPLSRTPFFYDDHTPSSNGGSSSSGAGTERSVVIPGLTSLPASPAVDATKLTRGELFALIDEDDDMVPLEYSKTWRRAGADSRLSVRRDRSPSQQAVCWADLPDSLDGLGGPGGEPSGDSHAPSDAEWEDIDDEDEVMDGADDSAAVADRERAEEELAMRDFKRARHAFMIEAEP